MIRNKLNKAECAPQRHLLPSPLGVQNVAHSSTRVISNNAIRSLERKVAAIKELNIASRELNVSQLKVMAMWYKRANDSPVPTTRSLLLARLLETCNRGDQVAPPLPNARPEPPPDHVVLVNTGADVVEQDEHQ
jgi:hypothetical protein